MVTPEPTSGNGLVGAIVCGPAPGIANAIVCGPPAAPFASAIAWRSEPAPALAVVVTVNVAAFATWGAIARAATAAASRRVIDFMPQRSAHAVAAALRRGCGDLTRGSPPPLYPGSPRRWRNQ